MTLTWRGRRRGSDPQWRMRNRLTRSAARMRGKHVDRLTGTLEALPATIGAPVLAAWNAKEDLLDLLATARTRPDRELVHRLLHRFYPRCAASELPELHRLATTIETWWPQIHAFLTTAITNAAAEGTNRVVKTVAANCRTPWVASPAWDFRGKSGSSFWRNRTSGRCRWGRGTAGGR